MITLSIIVPIYNTPVEKLERCINSIDKMFELTRFESECILVDDGSEGYIKEYCLNNWDNGKFKYIRKNNGGVSSARNCGIVNSKGLYLMFVDADDVIIPESFDFVLNYNNVDIIFSDLIYSNNSIDSVWKAFNKDTKDINIEEVLTQLSKNGKLNGPVCKTIRREFLNEHELLFPENMILGEDAVFLYNLLKCKPKNSYYPQPTYIYYHENCSSINRIKSNSLLVLNNYRLIFSEFVELLNCLGLNTHLIMKNLLEKHIKQLFNFKLDLRLNHCFNKTLLNEIKIVNNDFIQRDFCAYKMCSLSTRFKAFLLCHNIALIEYAIGFLRKVYLLCH